MKYVSKHAQHLCSDCIYMKQDIDDTIEAALQFIMKHNKL